MGLTQGFYTSGRIFVRPGMFVRLEAALVPFANQNILAESNVQF